MNRPNRPARRESGAGDGPSRPAPQERLPTAQELPEDARRALEKLRALDGALAQRYEQTRIERRRRRP